MSSKSRALCFCVVLTALLTTPAAAGQGERRQPERSTVDPTHRAFAPVVAKVRGAVFGVHVEGQPAALATMIDAAGLAITKASELPREGKLELVNRRGTSVPAEVLARDRETDLALLRVETPSFKALTFTPRAAQGPALGRWLVSAGIGTLPVSSGIVSVKPRAIPAKRVLLGVEIQPGKNGPAIRRLIPDMGAAKAGLLAGDVITHVGDKPTRDRLDVLKQLKDRSTGDSIDVKVLRDGKPQTFTIDLGHLPIEFADRAAHMNRMGGEISARAHGFTRVIQHDSFLHPHQVGGPVLDLDGNLIGINIARAGRIASYVLPNQEVAAAIQRLRKAARAAEVD